jgi:YD repeat-containing protein
VVGPNSASDTTSFKYDALGRTISATDRFGLQTATTFTFDTSISVAASSVTMPNAIPTQTGATNVDSTSAY